MISQTVEYALRAVAALAKQGAPCTAQKLAEITHVPGPYLSKLMQRLVRTGLVRSQRGLHGGFALTKTANELTIWEVIEAVEPFQRIHECPLGIGSHGNTLCPLHSRLDQAMESVEISFRNTKLSELMGAPGSITPLCETTDKPQVVTLEFKPPS